MMEQRPSEETTSSMSFRSSKSSFFAALGPVLMVSMSYIDIGKWVAAVEAGSRFGSDLILPVFCFNLSAILCQYLASCISIVTGKNLAEICSEEYSRFSCFILGVQAELSLLASELTMIFGIAQGVNFLFGSDLLTSICIAVIAPNLLFFYTTHIDNQAPEKVKACVASFVLLCYVLGLLVSQPEVPITIDVIFPRLSGESSYSLMALLGANVMAHNFYIHSQAVQEQSKASNLAISVLFNDHLFSILFIFTGIFLVNYVLMNSAIFSGTEALLNFQDVVMLMDQIFRKPIAPVVFLLVLFFSGQIMSSSCHVGGQVVARYFFGLSFSNSIHHLFLIAVAMVLTIYYAKVADFEGVYQLLIICQVIQAMLLPSSVIPLFRVASSRSIMGNFKISWYLEIFTFLAFLVMLFANVIFAVEMMFGDNYWMTNLKGNSGTPVLIPYGAILFISCASITFSIFLAVTPLKSASDEAKTQEFTSHSKKDVQELSKEVEVMASISNDEIWALADETASKDLEFCQDKSNIEYVDSFNALPEADYDPCLPASGGDCSESYSADYILEESKSVVEEGLRMIKDDATSCTSSEDAARESSVLNYAKPNAENAELNVVINKTTEEPNATNFGESVREQHVVLPSTTDVPPLSPAMTKGIHSNSDDVGGRPSESGLGRASRRQLAAILDEFWGCLFDYHGKLVQQASLKKFDVLLGLDHRTISTSMRMDHQTIDASKNPLVREPIKRLTPIGSSRELVPPMEDVAGLDLTFGLPTGLSGWSQHTQSRNAQLQNSVLDQSGKLYNFSSPQYSNDQYYQPATIHGYQFSSYLKGLNASRNTFSSTPSKPMQIPTSSPLNPNVGNPAMYASLRNPLGSIGPTSLHRPNASHIGRLVTETSCYDPFGEDILNGSAAYSKKYHSSPDVSALIAATRNALLNEGKPAGPMGTQSYIGSMEEERSQFLDRAYRTGHLAFDGISQPQIQRDFSMRPALNSGTNSLWAKQPFEHMYSASKMEMNRNEVKSTQIPSGSDNDDFSYAASEADLLRGLRSCIRKLLKLEGSRSLFKKSSGCDEELIDHVAAIERLAPVEDSEGQLSPAVEQNYGIIVNSVQFVWSPPNCGDDCIWRASLVVSFGVWCIRRILELSLVESRPELWGKYTYVLNRLQGILDLAFSTPRAPLVICQCLQAPIDSSKPFNVTTLPGNRSLLRPSSWPLTGMFTTVNGILEIIKDVEVSVSGRKGRSGTAAGDVAFPKGKENLSSVLKRYKRRLSNMPTAP